jgi:hypothetical protein
MRILVFSSASGVQMTIFLSSNPLNENENENQKCEIAPLPPCSFPPLKKGNYTIYKLYKLYNPFFQ